MCLMIICVICAMAQAIDIAEEMRQKTTLDTQVSRREQMERCTLVWSTHDFPYMFLYSSLSIISFIAVNHFRESKVLFELYGR